MEEKIKRGNGHKEDCSCAFCKPNKTKIPVPVMCTGLICITSIEIFALYLGYDGYILAGVIGIIGAAIGLSLPQLKFK